MNKVGIILFLSAIAVIITGSFYFFMNWSPRIYFPAGITYSFGVVDEGKKVEHAFVIENKGMKALEISKLISGCGCTSAKAVPVIIPPKEKGRIIVSYVGRPLRTQENLVVTIFSNDPRHPLTRVAMNGNVRTKVFWYPESVSISAKQGAGNESRQITFLKNNSMKMEIISLSTSGSRIHATTSEEESKVLLNISLAQDCPVGNWTEFVYVTCITDLGEKKLNIPVYIFIL